MMLHIPPLRIPPFILVFFAIDVALGLAYLGNYLLGSPDHLVTAFLNLGGEKNLPTWYSSIQWFCAAALLGIFMYYKLKVARLRPWVLLALPLVFLGLSLDELAEIHEKIGMLSDALLPGASRGNTLFSETGIWMFLLGVPFVVVFVALILSVRTHFQETLSALVKIILGMALMLTGALGIEALSNFTVANTLYGTVQVLVEEMCEMLGATVVLWGGYELLEEHGFALHFAAAVEDDKHTTSLP